MSRFVPYKGGPLANGKIVAAGASDSDTPIKDRIEAISKYIPAEILAFYVPAVSAVALVKNSTWHSPLHWLIFVLAWALVPVYFLSIDKEDDRRKLQAWVSSLAFPIWAYVTNRSVGPLGQWYDDAIGMIVMLLFSLLTAFILPKRDQ